MGFIKRLIGHTRDLNRMANGVANVVSLLDKYDQELDSEYLFMAAWVGRVGIQEVMESGTMTMLPNYTINVPLHGIRQNLSVAEAYMLSIGRLMKTVGNLDEDTRQQVLDIVEGKEAFKKYDRKIPDDKKRIFL